MNLEESKNLAVNALGYIYALVSANLRKDQVAIDILMANNEFEKSSLIHSSLAISSHIFNSLGSKKDNIYIKKSNSFETDIFYKCIFEEKDDPYILYETIEILSKSNINFKDIILPPLILLINEKSNILNKDPILYIEELCRSIQYIRNSFYLEK